MAVRGFGDFLRRQLRPALELCLPEPPPPAPPGAPPPSSSGGGAPPSTAGAGSAAVGVAELGRLGFLLSGPRHEPLAAALGLSPGSPALTLEGAAGALRGLWGDELGSSLESPRLMALAGGVRPPIGPHGAGDEPPSPWHTGVQGHSCKLRSSRGLVCGRAGQANQPAVPPSSPPSPPRFNITG
jgi:hypothetical protein